MRYEGSSLQQFTDYDLEGFVQEPRPLKIKLTASVFPSEVVYVKKLDSTKFVAIDNTQTLYIWDESKLLWDKDLQFEKKIYHPEAKIDLG